ncbi:MAG: dihydroorotate dehydrogenase-like protein [Anaerolineae bacterium]|nr:dihydroorotate dehydrogenase-like protein [Anaerolineae bacterium]MCA9895314.1 dihydroorotate dehydrogenase-like protein [Anaerolineae bacterium]MCB9461029.1 dihydroorotate dehydrogenase-like protein [Anaerolineaceae bacterium]
MNIQTKYLGFDLRSPLVASASPLAKELDNIKKMEDAGLSAVVLNSLYEEEIRAERQALLHHLEYGTESYAEALSYFPEPEVFYAKTDAYLEHISKCREAVDIPVIASLNGSTLGGWTEFALKMQEAGASALELNIYSIPTDFEQPGADVEQNVIGIVNSVKEAISIPVAVKLSPYYSNMAHMAKKLDDAGADALVLFNRFYQPDINLETMETEPNILLSTPQASRLPLRWIGILYGNIQADMAATSGIHSAQDALKMLMVGANVTMMTSALLKFGIDHAKEVEAKMVQWLEENEYESVEQLRGSMSQKHGVDAAAFERAQYMRGLKTYAVNS